MQDGHDRAEGEGELEAEHDVGEDAQDSDAEGDERFLEERAAEGCGNNFLGRIDGVIPAFRLFSQERNLCAEGVDDLVGVRRIGADGEKGPATGDVLLLGESLAGEVGGLQCGVDIVERHVPVADIEGDDGSAGEVDAE